MSPFGKQVVAEMNRLGIMIDVAHVSDDTFRQVLALSKAPVIASHSSLRYFVPGFERNVSDDLVKQLARNAGVVMINFGSGFVTKKAHDGYSVFRKAWGVHMATLDKQKLAKKELAKRRAAFIATFKKTHKQHFATVKDVADHIERVVKLVGIDHVGLGSDFDGVGDSLPVGLKDVSEYPNLIAELLRRKFSDQDIAKLCSGNVLRVWRAVEAYAAKQASTGDKTKSGVAHATCGMVVAIAGLRRR